MTGPSLAQRQHAAQLLHELGRPATAAIIGQLPRRPGLTAPTATVHRRCGLSSKEFWLAVRRLEDLGALHRNAEGRMLDHDQLDGVAGSLITDSPLNAIMISHRRLEPFVQWGRVTRMPTEADVIDELYEASKAGVKIDLIIRGVCSLQPGVPGLSENITVRSIVGRFLEHHRIYYFYAGGEEHVYLSSADWMDRNLFRRVEVAFPVQDRRLKRRVIAEGLSAFLGDNQAAWLMQSDGHYRRRRPGKASRNAQLSLLAKFCS